MDDLYRHDVFLTGRSAMAYGDDTFRHHLEQAKQQKLFTDEWGVVALSANAAGGSASHGLRIPYVFAINAASPERTRRATSSRCRRGPASRTRRGT